MEVTRHYNLYKTGCPFLFIYVDQKIEEYSIPGKHPEIEKKNLQKEICR